jgi:hypothetical protein
MDVDRGVVVAAYDQSALTAVILMLRERFRNPGSTPEPEPSLAGCHEGKSRQARAAGLQFVLQQQQLFMPASVMDGRFGPAFCRTRRPDDPGVPVRCN